MTVTVYLEGPTKASRRLSPLTTRALGFGQASWHTTLAAGTWGQAVSWVGVGGGAPEQTLVRDLLVWKTPAWAGQIPQQPAHGAWM